MVRTVMIFFIADFLVFPIGHPLGWESCRRQFSEFCIPANNRTATQEDKRQILTRLKILTTQ